MGNLYRLSKVYTGGFQHGVSRQVKAGIAPTFKYEFNLLKCLILAIRLLYPARSRTNIFSMADAGDACNGYFGMRIRLAKTLPGADVF